MLNYNKITPDGWSIDHEMCAFEKDGSDILAMNPSLVNSPLWILNYAQSDILPKTFDKCWDSIAWHWKNSNKAALQRAWEGKKYALGHSLKSYSVSNKNKIVISGIEKSKAEDLRGKQQDYDELWIGVNWAINNPSNFDLCWFNSIDSVPQLNNKRIQECPTLICSLGIDTKKLKWQESILWYASPAVDGMFAHDIDSIGKICEPGDPLCAVLMWGLSIGISEFELIEADVTVPEQRGGAFKLNNRWAFKGQGFALASLMCITHMAKLHNIKFKVINGYDINSNIS